MACNRCKKLLRTINTFNELEFVDGVIDKHIWLFEYDQIKDILCDCKYRGEYSHYQHLSNVIARAVEVALPFTLASAVLTYVPTISSHKRERGSDHAYKLANEVATRLNTNVKPALIPTHTSAQAGSAKSQRLKNPHFIPIDNMCDLNVILVDDISSTKSTLMHAARALKRAGAKSIIGVTIANRSK